MTKIKDKVIEYFKIIDGLNENNSFLLCMLFTFFVAYLDVTFKLDNHNIQLSLIYMISVFFGAWKLSPLKLAGIILLTAAFLMNSHLYDILAKGSQYPVLSNSKIDYNAIIRDWRILISGISVMTVFTVMCVVIQMYYEDRKKAHNDPLTNTLNRQGFNATLMNNLIKTRNSNQSFSLLVIDIDNFHSVNDTLGRDIGDHVLRTVSSVINDQLHKTECVARTEGDEFVVYLSDLKEDEVRGMIAKIKMMLDEVMFLNGYTITFSIGGVLYKTIPAKLNDIIHQADSIMRDIKRKTIGNLYLKVFNE